jgi:hypothetical protein
MPGNDVDRRDSATQLVAQSSEDEQVRDTPPPSGALGARPLTQRPTGDGAPDPRPPFDVLDPSAVETSQARDSQENPVRRRLIETGIRPLGRIREKKSPPATKHGQSDREPLGTTDWESDQNGLVPRERKRLSDRVRH